MPISPPVPLILSGSASSPEDVDFTYNGDGTIDTITKSGGTVITFTYNVDGTIDTISDGSVTRTFVYSSGQILSIEVS